MENRAVTNFLQLNNCKPLDTEIFKEVRGCNWSADSFLKDTKAGLANLPDEPNYQVFAITVGGEKRVGVHFHCEFMGPWGAFDKTTLILKEAKCRKWPLNWIFVVGCCGASVSDVKKKDFPRGTILIANQIMDYLHTGKLESVKTRQGADQGADEEQQGADETEHGADLAYTFQVEDQSYVVRGSAQSISMDTQWLEALKNVGESPRKGDFGDIAAKRVNYLSGPLVIKDAMFSTKFRGADVPAAGVEMEVVGVYKAVKAILKYEGSPEETHPKIVLVKGICDYTGGKGEKGSCRFFDKKETGLCTEDELQVYATLQSIALVIRFVAEKIRFI